ncbi:MAG TPA: cob(I)yrinic acid a,c-diamide adenosyltransferase [Candidatus Vogelbacteria bacterium]|nr:cob(I)yrinic acid a,c-diamide adenosyltransferase [Candidatus Vogelbacteria bacterium]
MLYTKKGDKGDTNLFHCDQQKISKDSAIVEALGELDELNSFLGLARVEIREVDLKVNNFQLEEIIRQVQENLFIIQAEVAGADKKINDEKIEKIEQIIDWIEKEILPIKSFFLPGASKIGAWFDVLRSITRRVERRAVVIKNEAISQNSLAYLNRLSSLFYALARLTAHKSGITEESPEYK